MDEDPDRTVSPATAQLLRKIPVEIRNEKRTKKTVIFSDLLRAAGRARSGDAFVKCATSTQQPSWLSANGRLFKAAAKSHNIPT